MTPAKLKQMVEEAGPGREPAGRAGSGSPVHVRGGRRVPRPLWSRCPGGLPYVAARQGSVGPAMELAYIPSPSRRRDPSRPDPAARLRVLHHHRRLRRRLARQQALDRPRRPSRHGRRHRRVGRALRPGRRPALPRHHRLPAVLRRGPRTGSTPSRSGRAASASGARSRSARWAPGSAAAGAASRCPRAPTPSRPASPSRRRSAAGATGSTRSCTGGPTDLPWARARSRRAARTAGCRATTTRRSCTSRCGASVSRCWSSGPTAASSSGTAGRSRCTSPPYCVGPLLDRVPAGRRRPPHPRPAAERLDLDLSSSSLAVVYIVLSARKRPGREEVVEPEPRVADESADGRIRTDEAERRLTSDGRGEAEPPRTGGRRRRRGRGRIRRTDAKADAKPECPPGREVRGPESASESAAKKS